MARVKNVTPQRGGKQYDLPERIYLVEILKGMGLTIGHAFRNLLTYRRAGQTIVTIQYPEQQRGYTRFRGMHRLKQNEDGSLRCVACKLCQANCPSHCIHVEAAEYPEASRGHYPERYDIDITRCIFCGYCVEACPKDAIEMTQVSEMADTQQVLFDKDFLLHGERESGS